MRQKIAVRAPPSRDITGAVRRSGRDVEPLLEPDERRPGVLGRAGDPPVLVPTDPLRRRGQPDQGPEADDPHGLRPRRAAWRAGVSLVREGPHDAGGRARAGMYTSEKQRLKGGWEAMEQELKMAVELEEHGRYEMPERVRRRRRARAPERVAAKTQVGPVGRRVQELVGGAEAVPEAARGHHGQLQPGPVRRGRGRAQQLVQGPPEVGHVSGRARAAARARV